jgi:maltose-binding protein MalE
MLRVVACLLVLLVLSACDMSASATTTPPTQMPGSSVANTTLLLWHGWGGPERLALARLVDRFNEQHPNGRVLLQTMPLATFSNDLRTAAVAGTGPHLMIIPNSWVGGLADAGALRPLDDLIDSSVQNAMLPATLGGSRAPDHNGASHLYGLPISFDTLALFYNTANILSPPDNTTDLISGARGLSDPRAPRWGLALNLSLDNTIGYLYAFDGRVFDESGQLVLGSSSREQAEKWLNWLRTLHSDTQLRVHPASSIGVDRDIKYGRVLMTFDWAHQISVYRSLWGGNMGIAPLPRLSETGKSPRPYVKSELLAINTRVGPAERDAAAEFLRFMSSADAQRELLHADLQPARADLALDGNDAQAVAARAFRSQAEQGLPLPNDLGRGIVDAELRLMLERVLMDQASPADAIGEADQRIREKLKLPSP